MKRALMIVFALFLAGAVALAYTPELSSGLIDSAKQALVALSTGDFQGLSDRLPFSGAAPEASQWQQLAGKFANLESVQTDYAVGFWTGNLWVIAVPVQPPAESSVEALAFSSADGNSFDACRYSTWGQIEEACNNSNRVIWNQEYLGGSATVVADLADQG